MSLDGFERIETVIGLEVHCQLRTRAKLFSTAPADGDGGGRKRERPNVRTAPLDLGHPGTLPTLNAEAVRLALRLALALDFEVAPRSSFARKHYFYPDLSKGYQITQHDAPLCYDGRVEVPADSSGDGQPAAPRRVRLRRLHLEEDAGKSLHRRAAAGRAGATRVDYNRAGTPLVELVTEPDLRSPGEAARFMRHVHRTARYLGVSDGRLETGAMRCDANVSLRVRGGEALTARVEIKNVGSFRNLERALRYEAARQMRRLDGGAAVRSETRRWDEENQRTVALRNKESAPDYRYLPEPDLPPLVVTEALLDEVRKSMPEGADERQRRLVDDKGLPPRVARLLTEDRALADFYEKTVSRLFKLTGGGNTRRQAQRTARFLTGEGRRVLASHPAPIDTLPVRPAQVAQIVFLLLEEDLTGERAAAEVFDALLGGDAADDPEAIAREKNLLQESSREDLVPVIEETLERHSKNVHRYKSGKRSLMGFFIGQVRSNVEDDPDPKIIRELLEERLD